MAPIQLTLAGTANYFISTNSKALVKTQLSGVQDNATLVIYLARVVRKRLIILITEK